MLIIHFPAFPGLWKPLQKKPGKCFFPLESQVLLLSHGTGGLTRLSATLGTNCPWFIQNYLGSYDSHLLHNSSQVTGSEVPFPDPSTSGTAAWPCPDFQSLLKEQESWSSSLALGLGNVELQVEKWNIFPAYYGKVAFVRWVMGLELSQEYSCVMWEGANQLFKRSLLWSLGSSWKNLTFCVFLG